MAIQYRCEGCGDSVHYLQLDKIPKHHYCFTCSWIECVESMSLRFEYHERFSTMRKLNLTWGYNK